MGSVAWTLTAFVLRSHRVISCHLISSQGRAKSEMSAQKLWFAMLEAQIETGNPYMLYKVCRKRQRGW